MKDFKEEIHKLFDRFQQGAPFSFSKFADGEWAVITEDYLNNSEFEFTQQTPKKYREELIAAIQYKDPDYYIGTCCPCCNGDRARAMREFAGQDEDHMTFANVFVNANYSTYKDLFVNEYKNHDVRLVCNINARVEDLPFQVEKDYRVGFSAWVSDHGLIRQIQDEDTSGKLYLFACGPFGNLLAHQLHDKNKNNIYLDIGSTLNPWLQSEGFKRDYYTGGAFGSQTCRWE